MNAFPHIAVRLRLVAAIAALCFPAFAQQGDPREEFQRFMTRGLAAVEMAKTPADYEFAAAEFMQAARLMPNSADPYFNMGTVMQKADKPAEAIQHYRRYLELAPEGHDAASVRTEIYKLEYRLERMRQTRGLSGNWSIGNRLAVVKARDNGEIELEYTGEIDDPPFSGNMPRKRIRGRIDGNTIVGEWTRDPYTDRKSDCAIPMDRSPAKGVVRGDGNEVVFTYKATDYQAYFNTGGLFNPVSCLRVVKIGEVDKQDVMRRAQRVVSPATAKPGAVGLVVQKKDDRLEVFRVEKGSPAEAAGIMAGDILRAVDGQDTTALAAEQVVELVRGEVGTTVKLLIEREAGGERKRLTVTVTRKQRPPTS